MVANMPRLVPRRPPGRRARGKHPSSKPWLKLPCHPYRPRAEASCELSRPLLDVPPMDFASLPAGLAIADRSGARVCAQGAFAAPRSRRKSEAWASASKPLPAVPVARRQWGPWQLFPDAPAVIRALEKRVGEKLHAVTLPVGITACGCVARIGRRSRRIFDRRSAGCHRRRRMRSR